MIASKGGIVNLCDIEEVVSRQTQSGLVNAPLAVSASRGLAAVCALQRITVYDLEDVDTHASESNEDEAIEAD